MRLKTRRIEVSLLTSESGKTGGRLASLDALRGFDMFFILGGATLISGLCAAFGAPSCWLARQMGHVPWAGLAQHDTIFPLFLFLAGVSWPFSLASQRARGRTAWQIHRKLLARVATLFLIGLSFGGILKFNPNFRLSSVLGFIGLSWGVAALITYHVRKWTPRLAIFALLALGYFVLLHFFCAPGAPVDADFYSKEWNVIAAFDRALWPNHLYAKGVYDPESLMSLPGGVVVALGGMFAGELLRLENLTGARKAAILLACSVASLALAFAFIFLGVPIVKALWTVSFDFAALAYSFALLALFYWIVDVRGCRRWIVLFEPIGKNSILVYVLMMTGVLSCLTRFLFTGCIESSGDWKRAVSGFCSLLIVWAIARYCQKKNVYLKA